MAFLPKVQSCWVALGLLASGCSSVAGGTDVDLEPGVNLPDATESDTEDPDDPDDPDSATGTSGDPADDSGDPPDEPTGTSGEPSDDDGPPSCNDETIQLTVEPPHVVLLLDKSGSMVQSTWDHDGDTGTPAVTRWNSLYTVVDTLTHDVEDGIELGMVLFPSASLTQTEPSTACLVDPEPAAPVAPGNADAIVGALPGPDSLEIYGGTPVSAGMQVVLDHLAAVADGRPQAVVLVTDGAANCMAGTSGNAVFTQYDDDLAPMLAGAHAAGIPTYVVGVDILDEVGTYPVANPYERLSELAEAGGVPQPGGGDAFYNTTDEEQLLTALGGIAAELSCTIELETPAEYAAQLRVEIDGATVERVDACSPEGEGWRYLQDAAPFTSIELCPASCDLAHLQASLDVEYACIPQG
ncbi:MAG: VWA domain-containing protein [Myxococcales bacterium]|nr:VWA domain-containing protein [Myxococcales bacterium]